MSYHRAPQFEMRFAAEVEAEMQRFTLGKLREMREGICEELGKTRKGMVEKCLVIAACVRESHAAFAKALEWFPKHPAVRRRIRTLRTLCLYIAARERMATPATKTAADLPPPPNACRNLCPTA